jgi:hypothetical protein
MRRTERRSRRTPAGGGRVCLGQWPTSLPLTIQSMLVVWIAGSLHDGLDWLLHKSHRYPVIYSTYKSRSSAA